MKIRLEACGEHELAGDDKRHRLVFSYSNLETVIHLSDKEFGNLRTVVHHYNPVTRQAKEL